MAITRTGLFIGLALGTGAVLFGPQIARVARPAAKAAIRRGVEAYREAQVLAARAGEEFEDLVAEVQHEMSAEAAESDAAGAAGPEGTSGGDNAERGFAG